MSVTSVRPVTSRSARATTGSGSRTTATGPLGTERAGSVIGTARIAPSPANTSWST
ncbi:hypothetical protein GCM10010275_64110 [Streptomyces litmocidini]|uniref:hypothetical protein n=1 Tax=Streptomyces litmocidini TaxID=67318 RepID=UPI00167DDA12|nr:hypothetical protein [Streptomyces litmocidini]GGV13997.1 hypothetical protein GCM10010275_64110 [Streptomyces litmocidini]